MQCQGKLSHHLRKTPFEAAAINYQLREKQSGAKGGSNFEKTQVPLALWDTKCEMSCTRAGTVQHDELAAVV